MSKHNPLIDEQGEVRELTKEDLNNFRPASEVMPKVVEAYRKGRGPQKAPKKVRTTIRFDEEVINHFKEGGAGWQARMNQVLVEHIHAKA